MIWRLTVCLLIMGAAVPAGARTRISIVKTAEYFVCAKKVWTMAGDPLMPGCLHVRAGRIVSVDSKHPITRSRVPVFDYPNSEITPGLIDIHSHMALRGGPQSSGDMNEGSRKFAPDLHIIDSFDPYDPAIPHAVSGGVTTVLITPGSLDIVSGQSIIIKLKHPPIENMLMVSPSGVKATSWWPQTYTVLDQWLGGAEHAMQSGKPVTDPTLSAGVAILKREIPLFVHGAYPTGEIEPVLALADKYHFRIVIYHCESCDQNFEEIVARKLPVVVGPRIIYWYKGRDTNLAEFLSRKGLRIALTCDASNAEQKYLLDQAGLAVHYGMPVPDALRAITINPAVIVGLDKRIGSLEPGKDADFVVYSGAVFESETRVLRVFIDGKMEFEDTEARREN
jgi:imidazolonepropionase-like amidohydrolase